MRTAFIGLARLLMLAVVAQFFLAAMGAFDSAPNEESFQPHRMLGYGILLVAVVLTILAAVARMPGRIIGFSGLLAGMVLAQALIAAIARAFGDTDQSTTAGTIVFGLHAINGLLIMGVAEMIIKRAKEPSKPTQPVS